MCFNRFPHEKCFIFFSLELCTSIENLVHKIYKTSYKYVLCYYIRTKLHI